MLTTSLHHIKIAAPIGLHAEEAIIINNFEIQIQKAGELNECYLLGCYFGNLYLLDSQSLKYTKYTELEENIFLN